MVHARSLALAVLGLLLVPVQSAPAQDPAREPRPIFENASDARPAFDAACRRAGRDNQRVLVLFGGDWSVWCQRFCELTGRDRDVGALLREDFQTVLAEVGPDALSEGNAELADRLGARPIEEGVPLLLIVAANGEVLAKQPANAFERAESYAPEAILAFLKLHAPSPLDARDVLAKARAQAAQDGRKLLIHIGAPWCGWCHRLEDFLALPEIEPVIAKDLIDVKIDQDRMSQGSEVASELRGDRSGGIPWIVITDADLNELITSDGPSGNIGYPVDPEEITHFMLMMETVRENMTPGDLNKLRTVLDARGREIREAQERAMRERQERERKAAETGEKGD